MIKLLFGKPLITCDHPSDCAHYVHIKPDEAEKLKELGWISLRVGDKLIFFCSQCKRKPAAHKTANCKDDGRGDRLRPGRNTMSHVTNMDIEVNDLDALKKAAPFLGMELVQQPTYKWYGTHVGDYPLPEGFTAQDLGKCEYALRVVGNPRAYEVGVVRRKDGKPGYQLLQDFWQGGYGLEQAIGKDGLKLKDEYGAQVALKAMLRAGHRARRTVNSSGQTQVKVQLRAQS